MSVLDQLGRDLGWAARGLVRARAFAFTAILTMAIGTAGTTLMFTLVEGVLLSPLPVREQSQLFIARKQLPSGGRSLWPFSRSEIETIGDESRLLASAAGVSYNGSGREVLVEDGSSSQVSTAYVTGRFFEVLGVEAILGRSLTGADDLPGAENVLVITAELWQRRYAGSPDAIGRRVELGGQPFRIVGVMPPDLELPRGVEAWLTVTACQSTAANPTFRQAVERELDLVARMSPGVTLGQARTELRGLLAAMEADASPGAPSGQRPVLRSYADVVVGDVRKPLLVLFGAVALVLIIASANVANLLLLRGESRREELAIRAALGAGRARLLGQVAAEAVVLVVAASAIGLLVTPWALKGLVGLMPEGLPRVSSVRVDARVVLFTLAVGLIAASVSVLPALSSFRVDLVAQLGGGRFVGGSRPVRRFRRGLVVAQVALAVTVVAAAGLLSRSLLRLQGAEMGMAAEQLVFVPLELPQAKYGDSGRLERFLATAVARLEAAPEVRAATPVNSPPFSGTGGWDAPEFSGEGQSPERASANPSLNFEAVHPSYFSTFGITLVRGRTFRATDRWGAPEVVILSEDVAEHAWPGEDPIGKRLKLGNPRSEDPWRTVVGVVGLTRYRELADPRPTLYVPAEQLFVSARTLVLRTAAPLALVAERARAILREVDPQVQVTGAVPFAELLEVPLARPRFDAFLVGVFGLAALLLATVGLYAVVAASVRQRYPEIAVRLALGATAADVRRLVLAEGMWLAVAGAGAGLVAAAASARVMRGLLFDAPAFDPVPLAGAVFLLVGLAALASLLPTRPATRLDVLAVLRRF